MRAGNLATSPVVPIPRFAQGKEIHDERELLERFRARYFGRSGWVGDRQRQVFDLRRRILRLERSIQIGRPVQEVFAEWSNFAELPEKISALRRVDVSGLHSNWVLEVGGRQLEFAAAIAQLIPNQAIGWKSITGPKHSGRIHFAQLGNDTLVHVSMNYAPPLGRFGGLLAPITDHLESRIEEALRDFKRALEESDNMEQGNRRLQGA